MAIDKDKILAGREAVGAYRTAHAKLYEKPWHRGIPEEHTPLLDKLKADLKRLGFNSLGEFFDANYTLTKETVESCFRLEGECDGCPDREKGCLPECYGMSEFSDKYQRPVIPMFKIGFYEDMSYNLQKFGEKPDGKVVPNCSIRIMKVKEPDIDWRWQ